MRNFTSVFALIARLTLHKVLLCLAVTAAAQTGYFIYYLLTTTEPEFLSVVLDFCGQMGFIMFYLLPFIQINAYDSSKNTGTLYTMRRLSISRRKLRIIHCLFNICCYTVILALQLLLAWAYCKICMNQFPIPNSQQSVFMAFTTSSLVTILFPYGRPLRFLINALVILGISWFSVPGTHIKGDDYDEKIQQNENAQSLPA